MFGSRGAETVTCIACGTELPREEAREYDKHGDRWNREGKEFEHFCKPCDRTRSHQPRRGLETTLVESGAGEVGRDAFLEEFCEAAEDRPLGER